MAYRAVYPHHAYSLTPTRWTLLVGCLECSYDDPLYPGMRTILLFLMKTPDFVNELINTLVEHKAFHIVELDLTSLTDIADRLIICSATSTRHASALADKIVVRSKQLDRHPLGVEGEDQSEWILVDLGDVIVHIMLPEIRDFYALEKLWSISKTTRQDHPGS
jgi:ribosome-associated protein